MALLIRSNGKTEKVLPENRKDFKLRELYALLGCSCIDTLSLADGQVMVIDDEGKLDPDHDVNVTATLMFREGRMNYHEMCEYMKTIEASGVPVIDARIVEGDDYIAGDVLICEPEELR